MVIIIYASKQKYLVMKNFISRTKCSLALYCGIFVATFNWLSAEAISIKLIKERVSVISAQSSNVEGDKKPKFPDRGIPTGRRRGGTSRSECPAVDKFLTAIVPGKETIKTAHSSPSSSSELGLQSTFSNSESFLTRTLQKYPNFWLHIPQATASSGRGEFVIQDEQDRDIYRTFFDLPSKSGIVDIKLPEQAQPLKVGRKYHWYVKVFCSDEQEQGEYIFVDAWIERVAATPKLERQLSQQNESSYQIYIENDLWHDAIDSLAKIRQVSPHNSLKKKRWNQLLSNLGLSDLTDKNMLDIRANHLAK